jgi:cytochrome c oxidase subunit 2
MAGISLAVVIVVLVIGSLIFHFMSPWYFTPIASNWGMIDLTVDITFLVCGIVFVAVNLFTVYCIFKYRHKPGQKADYDPENKRLEIVLTVVTAIGVAAMLTPGLFVWGDFVGVPEDARQVETMAKQWHWSYRFPGDDGVFGNTEVRHISVDNPFGLDPDDATGQDDILVTRPIVHFPVNEPIHLLIRSTDVLHNFTVPQFRVKMDAVPGMVTYQWFEPTVPGTYEVLCEELCGLAHFAMRSKVVVDTQEDFETWLGAQPTFAETQARPEGNATAGAALYAVCSACHGQRGEGNMALNAPKIAGASPWYIRRQIANYQAGRRGTQELGDTVGMTMAPMAATLTTPEAIENVIAYIQTLPDEPAEPTIAGDVNAGRETYQTCAACHGPNGEGRWNTNAPRLAGMSDWYLANQLENFRQRIRGAHEEDIYGDQMSMLASILKSEDAIDNVIAYINTL